MVDLLLTSLRSYSALAWYVLGNMGDKGSGTPLLLVLLAALMG